VLKAGDWAQITYKGLIDGEPEAAPVAVKTPWWKLAAKIPWRLLPKL